MSTTASLKLTRAWILDPLNPTVDVIVCGTQRPSNRLDAEDGEIRQFSGGRRQAKTTPTRQTTIPVTLIGLSYSQWNLVLKWVHNGYLLLWRSAQGERHYVTCFEAGTQMQLRTSMNDGRAFNVALTLYVVDHDEAV